MAERLPGRRGLSPRAIAAIALVLIGVLGGVVGFALDRTVMSPCSDRRSHTGERTPYWARSGEEHKRRWAEISKSLNLTKEQSTIIDSVLSQQSRLFEIARKDVEPRMRGIMDMTRARIDSVLTPDQKTQLDRMHKEREARRKRRPQG